MSQPPQTTPCRDLPEPATLRWRGLLHVASLRVAGSAMIHAPTLDDCALWIDRTRDELEGLESAIEGFRDLTGADITEELQGAAASLPLPESWLEVVVAQLVLSVAATLEAGSSVELWARQREGVAAARSALRDVWMTSPASLECVPELVERWQGVACSALDASEQSSYLQALHRELAPAPVHHAG